MDPQEFEKLISVRGSDFSRHVCIDLGTGDGLFVYRSALKNPEKFYIGVDANPRPLQKISEKIYRNPSRGGASNVLYLQASAEHLPLELSGIVQEVFILFPWGSLLRAVARGEAEVLTGLRRICKNGALLSILIGLDSKVDRGEIERLQLPELSESYVQTVLIPRYQAAGLEISYAGPVEKAEFDFQTTTWERKLRSNPNRSLIALMFRAI